MALSAADLDLLMDVATNVRSKCGRAAEWHILVRPDGRVGNKVVVPDVAGWRCERLQQMPRDAAIDVVPDWVCLLLRRDRRYRERLVQAMSYQFAGVVWMWRLFADDGVVESMKNDGRTWAVVSVHGDDVARVEPFEEVVFEFDRLFVT